MVLAPLWLDPRSSKRDCWPLLAVPGTTNHFSTYPPTSVMFSVLHKIQKHPRIYKWDIGIVRYRNMAVFTRWLVQAHKCMLCVLYWRVFTFTQHNLLVVCDQPKNHLIHTSACYVYCFHLHTIEFVVCDQPKNHLEQTGSFSLNFMPIRKGNTHMSLRPAWQNWNPGITDNYVCSSTPYHSWATVASGCLLFPLLVWTISIVRLTRSYNSLKMLFFPAESRKVKQWKSSGNWTVASRLLKQVKSFWKDMIEEGRMSSSNLL